MLSSISVSYPSTGNPSTPREHLRRASTSLPLYLTSPTVLHTCSTYQKHRSLSSRVHSGTPHKTHMATTVQSRTTAARPHSRTSRRGVSAGHCTRSSRSRFLHMSRVLLTGPFLKRPCRMGAGMHPHLHRPRAGSRLAGVAGGGETTGTGTGAETGTGVSPAVAPMVLTLLGHETKHCRTYMVHVFSRVFSLSTASIARIACIPRVQHTGGQS